MSTVDFEKKASGFGKTRCMWWPRRKLRLAGQEVHKESGVEKVDDYVMRATALKGSFRR